MISQQLSAHGLAPSSTQPQQPHSAPVDLTGPSPHSASEIPNPMPIQVPQVPKTVSARQAQHNKLADFLKANLENLDNKDLMAAHDTTWPEVSDNRKGHLDGKNNYDFNNVLIRSLFCWSVIISHLYSLV